MAPGAQLRWAVLAGDGVFPPPPHTDDRGGGRRDALICAVWLHLSRVESWKLQAPRDGSTLIWFLSIVPADQTSEPPFPPSQSRKLESPQGWERPRCCRENRRCSARACRARTPAGLEVVAERLGGVGTSWASEHGALLDPGSGLGCWRKAVLEPDLPSCVHIWPGLPTASLERG